MSTVTRYVGQSELLMAARCRLLTRMPWYGHIAMSMNWIPSEMSWMPEERRTMGVRIVNGGEVQCIYYPPFVDKLSLMELYGVIQHEIEHLVRLHTIRIGGRNPLAWNLACDMTVNGTRSNPRIGYRDEQTKQCVLPLDGDCIWIPDSWEYNGTSELFYSKIEKQYVNIRVCEKCGGTFGSTKKDKKGCGEGAGCGEDGEQNGGECNHDDEFKISGKMIDDHSVWNQSDVSEDEARQVVRDIVNTATEKSQGNAPGHLAEAIQSLAKPIVKWREQLRSFFGNHVGNHRLTYSRRNRRRQAFGVPGVSHHAAATVTVIVDTSGSVSSHELEQFFAEIDAIASHAKVFVLQWDHAFQGYDKYRRGDWKKFKVNGRGGTDMAAPVQWLMDNRKVSDVQVMLTDGHCNWIGSEMVSFPIVTVITTPTGSTKGPGYGLEIRLKRD